MQRRAYGMNSVNPREILLEDIRVRRARDSRQLSLFEGSGKG